MDVYTLIITAVVVFLAAGIQSAVGFAYGLFAIPMLVAFGVPLPESIVIVASCSAVQSTIGAIRLRAVIPWRTAIGGVAVRLATVTAGIAVLKKIATLSVPDIKLFVGCVLCVLVIVQITGKIRPKERLHWIWTLLAFSTSGFLAGICGMGGPPVVFWLMAHNWSSLKTRGFLFAFFALSIPVQIFLLYLTFGENILNSVLTALFLLPAVYLGAKLGLPLGDRIPKHILRILVYLILFGIGLSSIIPAIAMRLN